jgi:two-component system chemotaxis response regulator CheB
MRKVIRVLVVDDSPTMRQILIGMLLDADGFEIAGQAQDGLEAVQLAAALRPDVIMMDIRMPRMNGLDATRYIMSTTPTRIVVVSNNVYEADLNIAFNAIAAGALTVVEKPKGLDAASYEAVCDQLVMAVRLMADVQVVALAPSTQALPPISELSTRSTTRPAARTEVIAIAASTGGPGVLNHVLSNLPADFSIPMVVVQHITAGFGLGMAHWLNGLTPLTVAIAQHGEVLTPGRVLIAPDDAHLIIAPGGVVQIDRTAPVDGLRPSATRLFSSIAQTYGAAAVGVILSGMGDDGVEGLGALRQAGGRVIAQSEESCVVFGMPKVAIERGLVDEVLAPDNIVATLKRLNEVNRLTGLANPKLPR